MPSKPPDQSGRRSRRIALLGLPDVLLAVGAFLIPLGLMVAYSFGRADPTTQDVEITGTLDRYRALWSDLYRPVVARSFALAAITVVLCVIIGTPAAIALSRLSARWRTIGLGVVVFPSFVSYTVRVYAWTGVLGNDGWVDALTGRRYLFTPVAVAIGMVAGYLPLFVIPAYAALTRVGPAVREAAFDLGARRGQETRHVTLPLAAPGVAVGAALVGVLAVGEFIVPAILGGNKVLLLGTVLAERGAGRDKALGGAIVVVMLGVALLCAGAIGLARRRRERG
jgi:spermidine/putrescine transport system permease protein